MAGASLRTTSKAGKLPMSGQRPQPTADSRDSTAAAAQCPEAWRAPQIPPPRADLPHDVVGDLTGGGAVYGDAHAAGAVNQPHHKAHIARAPATDGGATVTAV